MKTSVSVIIPTYHRPELLLETVRSVWSQTDLPQEILIGDDSKDDLTQELICSRVIPDSPVPIRYFHHKPSLREVKNVDFLYQQAESELILHLHDDDPIYPNCIKALKAPFATYPEIIASFGLQRIIDESGHLATNAEAVNAAYLRTLDRVGLVDSFVAGATCMFPNNAFLVRKEHALVVGYSDNGRAGCATDFYFGFRLGKIGRPFYFVNEFTAMVRTTIASQSRNAEADNCYRTVKILFEDCYPHQLTSDINNYIRDIIPMAITTAIQKKDRQNAVQWLFSEYYQNKLLTLRGIKRIFLLLTN